MLLDGELSSFAVARYLGDGELDPSFSGDGRVVLTAFVYMAGSSLALEPAGRIIEGGGGGSARKFVLFRLHQNGNKDLSFGDKGLVATDVPGYASATDIALQTDGAIIVVGRIPVLLRGHGDFGVARYTPRGVLDRAFSGDGWVRTDIGGGNDRANAVVIQPGGDIVVAGTARVGSTSEFAVVRYLGR